MGVYSSFVPRLESRNLSILKIILTIQVLILQNIAAVMFKFSGGVDVRQSNMFKVMGGGAGASAMFKVVGGGAGASAMPR